MDKTNERLDALRERAYELLRAKRGERLLPVRLTRGLLSFVNDLIGRPLAPRDELTTRRSFEERRKTQLREHVSRVAEAEARARVAPVAAPAVVPDELAPVLVYVDGRSGRDAKRIADVLRGRNIPYRELDVELDEASRSFINTAAHGAPLPVVMIGDRVVGGAAELLALDVAGELVPLVFGDAHAARS